jgi:hypothetical protein
MRTTHRLLSVPSRAMKKNAARSSRSSSKRSSTSPASRLPRPHAIAPMGTSGCRGPPNGPSTRTMRSAVSSRSSRHLMLTCSRPQPSGHSMDSSHVSPDHPLEHEALTARALEDMAAPIIRRPRLFPADLGLLLSDPARYKRLCTCSPASIRERSLDRINVHSHRFTDGRRRWGRWVPVPSRRAPAPTSRAGSIQPPGEGGPHRP